METYLIFGVIGLALILLIILAVTGLLKNLFIWIGIQVDWAKSFFGGWNGIEIFRSGR